MCAAMEYPSDGRRTTTYLDQLAVAYPPPMPPKAAN
jgi:hypothetical protein